jgi:hypothetical protein
LYKGAPATLTVAVSQSPRISRERGSTRPAGDVTTTIDLGDAESLYI